MSVFKVSELSDGEYIICSYEETKFGYRLTTDQDVEFFSNALIIKYITDKKPTKKFKVIVTDGNVSVEGYSRKVILH